MSQAIEGTDRVVLDFEEAVAMLPDGDQIHTYRNPSMGVLIGADWSREDIEQAFREHQVELSGEVATRSGHGILFTDHHGYVFVATKESKPT